MKKPSLRFRQVFEHGTHFKVTRPMGNPITIAKSAISPTMQARLRKFAQGGEVRNYQLGGGVTESADDFPLPEGMTDEPVGAPVLMDPAGTGVQTPVFAATASEIAALARTPTPAPVPVAEVAPVAADEASPATPADEVEYAARRIAGSRYTRPVREAAASGRPRLFTAPGSVELSQQAVETAPAEPTPPVATTAPEAAPSKPVEPAVELTEEQKLATQLRGETKAAIEAEQQRIAKVREAETAAADLAADQAKAYQAEVERYQQQVADARKIQKEASDDMAAGRNVGSYFSRLGTWNQIGTALSLAAGAFASGMTGMPNFALQIYNNAMEKDLEKQREDRNSLWTKFVNAGNTAQEADQLVRASIDKALAARAAQQAAVTRNAKAADGFAKFSAELNQKSETAIARIEQSKAVAARARAETVLAEQRPEQLELEAARKLVKDTEEAAAKEREEKRKQEELRLKKAEGRRQQRELELKEKELAGYQETGAQIPDFLSGAKPDVVRKHRVEYVPAGEKERKVGFLIDPSTRKDFVNYSRDLDTVKRQAEYIREWSKKNPAGLASVTARSGPAAAMQQRAALEAASKTMIEGYIKNVTGIRRASSAAIEYMQDVVKNPAELKNFADQIAGANTVRFSQILNEIEEADRDLQDTYLAGGAPPRRRTITAILPSGQPVQPQ